MRLNKKSLFVLASLASPLLSTAAETTAKDDMGAYNPVLISLVCLIVILTFVIAMLANTLSQLGLALKEKNRQERKSSTAVKSVLMLIAFSVLSFNTFAAETAEAAKQVAAPVSNYIQGIPKTDFYFIMCVLAFQLAIIFTLAIYVRLLIRAISAKPETEAEAAKVAVKKTLFWDRFNKSVTVEKERDVLLDHDYDGIQELDNSLPPWWKYGFYLTIVISFIYIYRYHVSHEGPSQYEEFVAAMQKGEEEKAEYLAKSASNVDENSVTALTDGGELAQGKEIFVKSCAACHLADGGGIVGPNLTDPYWLHGGSIKDIFKSIKYGWQDKGMKSWKDDFSPKQLQQIASYVNSLKGTKPATPKAPQGDLYEDAATPKNDTKKESAATVTKAAVAVK